MKYSVAINEKKRTITVTLADGTKGVAKCNPTDRFDINTGIELALERAKVAQKNNNAKANTASPTAQGMTATMLAKQLEKILEKGQIIVAVGGGDNCLTEAGKKWLAKIAGGKKSCCPCQCQEADEYDREEYDRGYNDGYAEGYDDATEEAEGAETDSYNEGYEEGRASVKVELADILAELGLD